MPLLVQRKERRRAGACLGQVGSERPDNLPHEEANVVVGGKEHPRSRGEHDVSAELLRCRRVELDEIVGAHSDAVRGVETGGDGAQQIPRGP